MLAAPAVAQSASSFEPTHSSYATAQQRSYPERGASMSSYTHNRGGLSYGSSSSSSRGGGQYIPQQQQQYQQQQQQQQHAYSSHQMNKSISNSSTTVNGLNGVPSGMTTASSSNTIAAPSNAAAATRRQRRPDSGEIRRVGRIHYQELLGYLRSHLAKGKNTKRYH